LLTHYMTVSDDSPEVSPFMPLSVNMTPMHCRLSQRVCVLSRCHI